MKRHELFLSELKEVVSDKVFNIVINRLNRKNIDLLSQLEISKIIELGLKHFPELKLQLKAYANSKNNNEILKHKGSVYNIGTSDKELLYDIFFILRKDLEIKGEGIEFEATDFLLEQKYQIEKPRPKKHLLKDKDKESLLMILSDAFDCLKSNNTYALLKTIYCLGYQTATLEAEKFNKGTFDSAQSKKARSETGKTLKKLVGKNLQIIETFIGENIDTLRKMHTYPTAKTDNAMEFIYSKLQHKLRTGKKELRKSPFMKIAGDYHIFIRDYIELKKNQ